MRYRRTALKYRNQFLLEHDILELTQPRALDGVRFHREFCDARLGKLDRRNFIKIPPRLQRRLEYLLENPID